MKLESINFWFIVSSCVSLTFPLPNYGFGKHAAITLLHRLKCPLNLSSEQRKVSLDFLEKIKCESFWSVNFGLLGIKSIHGQPDSPSW